MRRSSSRRKLPPIIAKAERALKEAVRKTIIDHRRTGDPLVVWRNGKIVHVSPNRLKVR